MSCRKLGKPLNGYLCIDDGPCKKHNLHPDAYGGCYGCELERDGHKRMGDAFGRVGRGLNRKVWIKMCNEHDQAVREGKPCGCEATA